MFVPRRGSCRKSQILIDQKKKLYKNVHRALECTDSEVFGATKNQIIKTSREKIKKKTLNNKSDLT